MNPLTRIPFYCLLFLLLILTATTSCNSQKKVQRRGGFLLVKNSVKTDAPSIPTEEVEGFVQQKATRGRLSLFRPGVWIYETTSKGKQTKFKKKLKEKYGTAPVILDTTLAFRSEHSIRLYLRNKGFYHPVISHEFKYKKASAKAIYRVKTGLPYTIRNTRFDIADSLLSTYIKGMNSASLLNEGMIFDTYLLDEERDRVTQNLRNQGYYNFSKSNITYKVDTAGSDLKADLTMVIRQLEPTTVDSSGIPRYFIRNIYVMPDLEQALIRDGKYDTLIYKYRVHYGDSLEQSLYFIHGQKPRLKPIAVADAITLSTGQAYSQELITQTYKRLIGLPIVRSVNIGLVVPEDPTDKVPGMKWLDCNIKLTRKPADLISLGTEGTNSSGSLGMGVNLLFQNRNIFKRAETFRFKVNTGAELQGNVPQTASDKKLWIFNAVETGFETGIDFPRLLLPFPIINTDRNYQERTSLTAGYGFESRPAYSRNITTFSFSYQWSASPRVKHIFTPLELNFVRIVKDSAFQAYLNSLTDPQFIGQYNDHLLTMIRYSIIFSNMAMVKEKNLFFIRLNAETSGNIFNTLDRTTGRIATAEGYYQRFGVRYAQYLRTDIDIRKLWNTRTNKTIAFRVMTGAGIPYGNSEAIPFEKSFWLGGANDMRGWKLRSLGPGGYFNDSVRYDRTGDLMVYSSLEYRFPIYSFLHGGLFTDAGNIWLRQDNPDFPGGTFHFQDVGKQLAVDVGFGLRFDFSFFIFRLDWAFRMKNPEYQHQWFQPEDFRLRRAVWNFGIGYPF